MSRAREAHDVSVRAARASDLPRIWQLVLELAEYERMSGYVSGSEERLGILLFGGGDSLEARVVEHAGRIVGYALFYTCYSSFRTRRRLWLEDLYVEPPARGTGAGRALMRELARVALERGCDRVDWNVLDWNQLAIDFYERNGAGAVRSEWTQFGMEETALRRLAEDD
jgi:GNAT superfamily N-acetyltransferase